MKRCVLLCVGGLAVSFLAATAPAHGKVRQRDRFGIRGGIWPQGDARGSFGVTRIAPDDTTHYNVSVDEDATITPFMEVYALFHLGGIWWADGSLGWSTRGSVEVNGVTPSDTILFGEGRIDFFPLFFGVRVIEPIGNQRRPHNLYARAGGSLVFANESPTFSVLPQLLDNGIYSPGTEGAFGFLVAGGGEYYVTSNIGVIADAQFRYTRFLYARNARFNLSTLWLSVGLTYRPR